MRRAYNDAFADHVLRIHMDEEQFAQKIANDGVDLSYSPGAFEGERLVGFIMHAPGFWANRLTVYNAATGVTPAWRGKGLTQQMYEFVQPALRTMDVEQCLLEVIRENSAAWRSYEKVGFEETRRFNCYRIDLPATWRDAPDVRITHGPIKEAQLRSQRVWLDRMPSWQNSLDAVLRSPRDKIYLQAWVDEDNAAGYAIVQKGTGRIVQFAVNPDYRRHGVATALFRQMGRLSYSDSLNVLNIDSDKNSIHGFLLSLGFKPAYRQYEMHLLLN
ncbi:GNAT family N-acetyltransferase [Catalinimonas alkaloidigena]|uniref:GNAT family N-acetyltransferase n=1 Tax=Catalinimonas alkaloidigena TaxID=1075417 RepID=UPI0015A13A5E|nr:GNAT family N-acetyltransferase [Catalinimonas alkaloidigena]